MIGGRILRAALDPKCEEFDHEEDRGSLRDAVLGVGALTLTGAEARWPGGGAVAASVVGGLAAGALLGAATSGYGYGYGGYDGGYRSVGYDDGYYAPTYRTRRVVREVYGYGPRHGYDDDYGY